MTIPTDFYGKTAVKTLVTTGVSAFGTSHSFTGLDLGIDTATNTGIIWLVFGMTKNTGDTSGFEISNGALSGGFSAANHATTWVEGGSASSVLSLVRRFNTASPGGTRTLSFNTGKATRCMAVGVLVLGGAGSWSAANNDSGTGVSATGASITIDVQTNGIPIMGAIKSNGNAMSFTGATERGDQSPLAGYRVGWAFDNRQTAGSGKVFSFSSSGTAHCAMIGLSMDPGSAV